MDFNDSGKEFDRSSVAGRGAGSCPEVAGWDVQDFFWEGFVENAEQCVFKSCCFWSWRSVVPSLFRFAKGFSVEFLDAASLRRCKALPCLLATFVVALVL